MTNIHQSPNHLVRNHEGLTSFHFGGLHSVVPNSLSPHPHVDVRFCGGVKVELTPETAADLARRLPEALAALPFIPEPHDYVGGEE